MGISSARCVTTSGHPTAKAPFNMPSRKTNPLLEYPVELIHSLHTNAFVACTGGIAAQTTIVTKTPARMRKAPPCSSNGRIQLAKITQKTTSQLIIKSATKTCHLCVTNAGWKAAYMDTAWAPMICAVAALAKIQARKFHHPANQPHTRPYLPAVMEAQ